MIFATWASDDFGCDVYVRRDNGEFFIHVAYSRYAGDAPKSIDASSIPRKQGIARTAALDAYCRRAREIMEWIVSTPTVPVGGEHAGEMFVEPDWNEAIVRLRYLASRGYRVPLSIIRELTYRRDLELDVARAAA